MTITLDNVAAIPRSVSSTLPQSARGFAHRQNGLASSSMPDVEQHKVEGELPGRSLEGIGDCLTRIAHVRRGLGCVRWDEWLMSDWSDPGSPGTTTRGRKRHEPDSSRGDSSTKVRCLGGR